MEINVFEYANPGHFTLLDSVTRIFSSDRQNQVNLYLAESHQSNGVKLINRLKRENVQLRRFEKLNQNEGLNIIITPDYDLEITYQLIRESIGPVWMFVHNIDDWFELGLLTTLIQIKDALLHDKNPSLAYYHAKRAYRWNGIKKVITKAVLSGKDGHFIVLNQDLKTALSSYVPADRIKIIPFSVYAPEIEDLSHLNTRLRICIPGILSQKRRDYLGVFKLLSQLPEETIDKIEIDLLGGISTSPAERSDAVVRAAETLIEQGHHIHLRKKEYIELEEFDQELGKADIILGNLNLDQGGGSHYGKTKESGIPFTMVRAAKPGILPKGYSTLEGLEEATLYYDTYSELGEIVSSLISDQHKVRQLKKYSQQGSNQYRDSYQHTIIHA